jgi:DNA-binding MarR family transcriptional regulator
MKASKAAQGADGMELFRLFTEIAIIDQLVQNDAGRLLAPDLNMPQFAVLNHLARTGESCSLVQLARAMQVTKAAMTNTVGRLADKGSVSVSPDPVDKRGKRIELTAAGVQAHARAVALLGQRFDPALASVLPAARVKQARETLAELRQWLDARRND